MCMTKRSCVTMQEGDIVYTKDRMERVTICMETTMVLCMKMLSVAICTKTARTEAWKKRSGMLCLNMPMMMLHTGIRKRSCIIRHRITHSEILNVSCGVPQGSILECISIFVADDTNLLCCDRDLNALVWMINGGLEQLQTWFSVNRLSLNVSKTNDMILVIAE